MDRVFRIGDFCFRIISELPYAAPDHFYSLLWKRGNRSISTGCGKFILFRYWMGIRLPGARIWKWSGTERKKYV